jgi:hypothetical protein
MMIGMNQDEVKLLTKFTTDRNFLTKSYPVMKKANPETPILIREALDTEPRVWARFGRIPLIPRRRN